MKKILIFVLCVLSSICYGSITEVKNFDALRPALASVEDGSLVLFDVDEVLLTASDEFDLEHPVRKSLLGNLKRSHSKDEFNFIISMYLKMRQSVVLDHRIHDLLEDLFQKPIFVTAFTAWWTGALGCISHMEDLRLEELERLNLKFQDKSPFCNNYIFDDLVGSSGPLMVKEGIIFTSHIDKGIALRRVLEHYALHPKKIIFIDDNIHFLRSVEALCLDLHIDFLGLHYTESVSRPRLELDEQREAVRFDVLRKDYIWLNDLQLDAHLAEFK